MDASGSGEVEGGGCLFFGGMVEKVEKEVVEMKIGEGCLRVEGRVEVLDERLWLRLRRRRAILMQCCGGKEGKEFFKSEKGWLLYGFDVGSRRISDYVRERENVEQHRPLHIWYFNLLAFCPTHHTILNPFNPQN